MNDAPREYIQKFYKLEYIFNLIFFFLFIDFTEYLIPASIMLSERVKFAIGITTSVLVAIIILIVVYKMNMPDDVMRSKKISNNQIPANNDVSSTKYNFHKVSPKFRSANKANELPDLDHCGAVKIDNRIAHAINATIDDAPWLAVLGYKHCKFIFSLIVFRMF